MARSSIVLPTTDLMSDSGTVLWSLIQGEQLEFPVILNFLTNADSGYQYEAVLIEGANQVGSSEVPSAARSGGVATHLTVRVPPEKGLWNSANGYTREDVVSYGGLYYKLSSGLNRISSTLPTLDVNWVLYVPNQVFIQLPGSLSVSSTRSLTVAPSTSAVFAAQDHGLSIGTAIKLGGTAAPGGLAFDQVYYVNPYSFTKDLFSLSITPLGVPANADTAGVGVYGLFPGWSVQPTIATSVHGFLELSVSEPSGGIYPRTWKPLRGLVEFAYSPTQSF